MQFGTLQFLCTSLKGVTHETSVVLCANPAYELMCEKTASLTAAQRY